jgi:hypothetical protein
MIQLWRVTATGENQNCIFRCRRQMPNQTHLKRLIDAEARVTPYGKQAAGDRLTSVARILDHCRHVFDVLSRANVTLLLCCWLPAVSRLGAPNEPLAPLKLTGQAPSGRDTALELTNRDCQFLYNRREVGS